MGKRIAVLAGIASVMAFSFTSAAHAGTADQFTVPLSGDQVVPGPGDPDGTGGVFMSLGSHTGTLCFFADTANISTPLTEVVLETGTRGSTGLPIIQLYGASTDPDVSGCHTLDRALVRQISKNRSNYYLEVRNEEFPDGALRGQLG